MAFQTTENDSTHTSIVIRSYRHPDDFNSVRRIFTQGTMSGPGSPYKEGIARFSLYFVRIFCTFASGVLVLCAANVAGTLVILPSIGLSASRLLRACGGILMIASVLAGGYYWYYLRVFKRKTREYVSEALRKDLGDIVKGFQLRDSGDGCGLAPSSPSGFWVAEDGYEVVGCVGLDHMRGKDENSAEVRRLSVSPFHRRRGIGEKLMDVVIAHGQASGLESLALGTSALNTAAVGMYAKNGWVLEQRIKIKQLGIPLEFVMFRKSLK